MAHHEITHNKQEGKGEEPNTSRGAFYAHRPWSPFFWTFVLIVGVFIVWFTGFGWGAWGGWLHGTERQTSLPGVSPQDAAVLTRTEKARYVGEKFYIKNVPVQRVVDNFVLWVGPNNRQPTLLVLTGTTYDQAHHPVSSGDHISISGIVKKAPAANLARQNWHLSDQGAQQLEQQQAYLQGISMDLGVPARKNGNG